MLQEKDGRTHWLLLHCRSYYIYMGKDETRIEQEVNCIIVHTLKLFIPHNTANNQDHLFKIQTSDVRYVAHDRLHSVLG